MVVRILTLFTLAFLISACSSSGKLTATGPTAQLLSSYESVKLVFKTTANNSADIVPDLRGSIVGQLLGAGRFHRVVTGDEAADVVISLDITDYRRVGVAERVFIGIAAGPNRLTVAVSATDGKTGAVIRQFQATGESAAHPLSSEAGYADALRELSKEVMLGMN
jgi:hypothetical protein